MAWTGIWAAILHWLVAILNMCDYMRYVTDFTSESFGMYVGIIYISKHSLQPSSLRASAVDLRRFKLVNGVEELVNEFEAEGRCRISVLLDCAPLL